MQISGPVPTCSLSQGIQPFVGPLASLEMVSIRPELGVLNQLRLRNPDHFRAGTIHHSLPLRERLLADYSCSAVDLLEVLRDGVRVEQFFFSPRLGGILRGNSIMHRLLPPFGLRTLPCARSFPTSLAIPLSIGWPLGF